ncbi:type II toxin-antitoxin system RelE/ParE family toxin [Beijerinckia sp. L45]|uniref:type II toxin-antitoxin system RelE/ParE family toxin n=1 Tax=Beijerinckia sp. L45 TaxID=1641855 RepID=UPI00131AA46D|nr:type II toxin-antitoxin system RelE/ParE family toxin [Beijerinckia sp. L45]
MPNETFPADDVPGNLTRAALSDLDHILEISRTRWPGTYQSFRDTLLNHFRRIEDGASLGHVRDDVKIGVIVKFIAVHPSQYIIAYDEEERVVLAILPGKRDLPKLFAAKR